MTASLPSRPALDAAVRQWDNGRYGPRRRFRPAPLRKSVTVADHIDPSARDEALSLVDDERGYTWLSWRGFPSRWLMSTFPATPRRAATTATAAGRKTARLPLRRGVAGFLLASEARVRWLDEVGLDEAVVFPNYGLLWERRLSSSRPRSPRT
ncbi:hypothetical protein I553_10285 [Mycobacterium xenopi 4042]|uniref:Uncharacterized protein n=1 Tax=Mycobacterium xenopi 4042 TaxID=1299334 RepID=X8AP97_MYCXE|nr:hypothetical protein I553_10285 [Mycobacterium xenopi 4042]